MEYSSYENYTKADNVWIDKYPNTWGFRKLKFTASLINEKVEAKESTLEYMGLEHIESWTGKKLAGGQAESDGVGSVFQEDDVLFGKLRPYLAKVYKAETPGLATSEALVLRPEELTHPDFLKYYLLTPSFIDVVNGSTYGAKMPRANWDFIGELPVLLPSVEEQQKIAAFLDYKTQQIDQLIAKKKALIEKLEEKRIAVITQAVTKGLDKNVTLKPSGVDWLGDVPEHWDVRRLKFLSRNTLQYGANEAAEMDDSDRPRFIRITDVKLDGTLHEDTFRSIPKDIAEPFILAEGDILLARSGATVGKSFIYSKEWGIAAYAGYLIRFRVDLDVMNADYAYQFFQTSTFWANINSTLIQSTIQNFSAEKYANILMPLPPKHEQEEILTYLKVILTKLDGMTKKANDVISKLEEYRSALITSAVTGKIDVRAVELSKNVA